MNLTHIKRAYDLKKLVTPKRVLVLYGPRRVGKTTLIQDYLEQISEPTLFESGESLPLQALLESFDPVKYRSYFSDYQVVVIDEAQHIPRVGHALKFLVDLMPELKIVVSGSSSFDLSQQIGEPLTGRKWEYLLYPISYFELASQLPKRELITHLEEVLVFGLYPEVITNQSFHQKQRILEELTSSYLLKDVLELENLKSPRVLFQLVQLLAYQVGSQVSLGEIGTQLGLSYKTVRRYIDLLEKTFVIFSLGGLSRNLRNEVSKKQKYYFYDLGVRNAVIGQFQPLSVRNDLGALWENFMILELKKKYTYTQRFAKFYFWRTWEGKEIDLVVEENQRFVAFEFKWQSKKVKKPQLFLDTYPKSEFKLVTQDNFLEFVV